MRRYAQDPFNDSCEYDTVVPGCASLVPGHAEMAREYTSAAYKLNLTLNDLMFEALELDEV